MRSVLIALVAGALACDASGPPRCTATLAQACASSADVGPLPCGASFSDVTVEWSALGYGCSRLQCGENNIILVGGKIDSDSWRYVFGTDGTLIEADRISFGTSALTCVAGPDQPPSLPESTSLCTAAGSCNSGCALSASYGCAPGPMPGIERCGPSTVTMCDGTTSTFDTCTCASSGWWCTAADGGVTDFSAGCADAGSD